MILYFHIFTLSPSKFNIIYPILFAKFSFFFNIISASTVELGNTTKSQGSWDKVKVFICRFKRLSTASWVLIYYKIKYKIPNNNLLLMVPQVMNHVRYTCHLIIYTTGVASAYNAVQNINGVWFKIKHTIMIETKDISWLYVLFNNLLWLLMVSRVKGA